MLESRSPPNALPSGPSGPLPVRTDRRVSRQLVSLECNETGQSAARPGCRSTVASPSADVWRQTSRQTVSAADRCCERLSPAVKASSRAMKLLILLRFCCVLSCRVLGRRVRSCDIRSRRVLRRWRYSLSDLVENSLLFGQEILLYRSD